MNELTTNDNIDVFEAAMIESLEPVIAPLKHTFIPGYYIRELFMPKGKNGKIVWATTMVHNTFHPFFVLKGKYAVFSENDGEQIIKAPYYGITTPGTRRVFRIIQDTILVTVHATDIMPKDDSEEAIEEAVNKITKILWSDYENKLLRGHFQNNLFIPASDEQAKIT